MQNPNYVDNPFESPAVLSICTGIRGLERGVELAIGQIRTAAIVEIEAFIIENLLVGMEAGLLAAAPIWANLKTFDPAPFRGKIHGIMGGYPCQPFSTAGNRKGTEDPRHLFPDILRCVKSIRPVWCFFENVRGHLTMGYDEVYRSLRGAGYAVECGIYSAEEVGAPHQRDRLFILAILADANCPGFKTVRPNTEQIRAGDNSTFNASRELAHPNGHGPRADAGSAGETSREDEGEAQREERDDLFWERSRANLGDGGTELEHAHIERSQGGFGQANYGWSEDSRWMPSSGNGRWPAGPGQPQYDWESPRTIESSMGCRINGYSFREDFLRALGNSVVEQQAELAFIDLLRKHFKNTPHA